MSSYSRRQFLTNSSEMAAVAGLASLPVTMTFAQQKSVAANDKLAVALIGCKGMGWIDVSPILKLPEVKCISLCDVYSKVLNQRAAELEKKTGKKAKLYKDNRKLY